MQAMHACMQPMQLTTLADAEPGVAWEDGRLAPMPLDFHLLQKPAPIEGVWAIWRMLLNVHPSQRSQRRDSQCEDLVRAPFEAAVLRVKQDVFRAAFAANKPNAHCVRGASAPPPVFPRDNR
jgi:hypothetical protein